MTHVLSFPGFRVLASTHWEDLSEAGQTCFTLGDPKHGVGALQFSTALYRSGAAPHISLSGLRRMREDFERSRRLEEPFDLIEKVEPLMAVVGSYHYGGDFLRVWFVSDGLNAILATYVCAWPDRDVEADECLRIVGSIQFVSDKQVS